MNLVILKSRQVGKSFYLYEWQKEILKFEILNKRKEKLRKIFNI
jgi:hypothetical protein